MAGSCVISRSKRDFAKTKLGKGDAYSSIAGVMAPVVAAVDVVVAAVAASARALAVELYFAPFA
jgi:hypothetical protein